MTLSSPASLAQKLDLAYNNLIFTYDPSNKLYMDMTSNGMTFSLNGSQYDNFSLNGSGSFIVGDKQFDLASHNIIDWGTFKMAIANESKEIGLYIKQPANNLMSNNVALLIDAEQNSLGEAMLIINKINNYSSCAFSITGNGNVYCGNVYSNNVLLTSDIRTKKNIATIEGALDKVMQIRGVSFNSIKDENPEENWEEYAKAMAANADGKLPPHVPTIETARQMDAEKKWKRIGVIAQEVETVVPEVVRTSRDGTKAVAYPEMVGLLIEAIKEQQAQIAQQQVMIEELQADRLSSILRAGSSAEEATAMQSEIAECRLYQNVPNPFSVNTDIRYFLTEEVVKAYLYIYDMQGKQMKSLPITQRGEGAVQIQGSELNAGMYIYTLIADNKVVSTKRMILTD